YLQGLRNRLHTSGVHVLTVKPGFVDTRMTFGTVKPGMAADPAAVAAAILRGIEKGKSVVYVPGIWRLVMLVIRHIPESVFKRLKL
ncbi:MAG: short-chain dehydrogenase, partial [Gemmatimonadetes bacterium]|nr:short-chain dehydrogenase [Gemmatimonadota bacterium]NIT68272.1 short-chain dehydrogenase [Gemmatimonadota bacterium]NIU54616.1 short-chain dehydrogenase [Gemmatimonadota bacterium]NIV24843.1 short-chain dehydrogenase [Gemmatimonadota bacterium]NIW38484.1 short-chain dehydrogenase [Gemmatimonadota bacterium]